MATQWMSRFQLHVTFGKQANKYLSAIQALRCHRFFAAHPLSTSKWGTGAWVSENYAFWARSIKFFLLLPALHQKRLESKYDNYRDDVRMLLRFGAAMQACIARLMSTKRVVPDMSRTIWLYMDTMVEMDRWLLNQPDPDEEDDEAVSGDAPPSAPVSDAASPESTDDGTGKKKQPNFVKPNSLTLLSAAESHLYHGPATLYYEGGWAGERKIQSVRPLLSIKRGNAEWQRISLLRLHQHETIKWLLESFEKDSDDQRSREMEGVLHRFKNFKELVDHAYRWRTFE